jgi:multidrug efflux pump
VLNKYGISLEQVRTVLSQANANRPKGQLADERTSWESTRTTSCSKAVNYMPLIVAARNGAIVRLADLGDGPRIRWKTSASAGWPTASPACSCS